MKSARKFSFHPVRHRGVQFTCDYAVFSGKSNSSICYVTDKTRGRLVSIALNRFLNSPEGEKWLEKNT